MTTRTEPRSTAGRSRKAVRPLTVLSREMKRASIRDAAASVFARKGYLGASTSDIAERLGMTQSNLYYYFRSKDEALEDVCRTAIEGYLEQLTALLAGPGGVERKLRAAVRAHLRTLGERPDLYVTFLTCRQYLPEAARTEVAATMRAYDQALEALVATAVADGTFRADTDPALAVSTLLAMCNNPALPRRALFGRTTDELGDGFVDLFLRGVAAHPGRG
jgi:AcrR family transcriptional regulator